MIELISKAVNAYRQGGASDLLTKSKKYTRDRIDEQVRRVIWVVSDTQTEAYKQWMDYRIRTRDAKWAVGGYELGIGQLQYNFLCEEGLEPENTLLDIGCGSLRGGRHFIRYLDSGNYVGMDINRSAIEEGKADLDSDLLNAKAPQFVVNDDLKFKEFNIEFDFLLAQSVFTHLPKSNFSELLDNVHRVMSEKSTFYFTYLDSSETGEFPDDPATYSYSREQISEMASEWYSVRFVDSDAYPHPRDQRMAVVTIAQLPS